MQNDVVRIPPAARIPLGALVAELIVLGKVELPVIPSSVARIIALGGDENIDAERFAAVLRSDITVVGNLMRIANSAEHASMAPYTSIQQVIVRLGFDEVRRIALAVVMNARVFAVSAFAARMRDAIRHSFATASFAQIIARRKRLNVEESFMLGLLHDVGEPLLLQCLADIGKQTGISFDENEITSVLHKHHAELGASLAQKWQLPDRVVEAIACHHAGFPSSKLAHVLALAEAAANTLVGGDEAHVRQHASLEALSLYNDDVNAILGHARSINAACEVLGC